MSEWSNLPNAAHIDRVLAHVRSHPDKWDAVWDEAWGAARDAAWGAAGDAVWDAAWGAVRDAAVDAARGARGATWGACVALMAWDEAGELMDKPKSLLRFLAQEGVHAAVLLLPAVIAMEGSTT